MDRYWRIAGLATAGAVVAAMVLRQSRAPGSAAADASAPAPDLLDDIAVTARRAVQGVLPRGIRNNNPGNIRRTNIRWQGQAPVQTDDAYIQFTEAKYGLRALARLLTNYQASGFRTIRTIINRFAPPVENRTSDYVTHVCKLMGVAADATLTPGQLPDLMRAIIRHENGVNPYTIAEIAEGIRLAK